jgi:hypothetical protein
VIAIPFDLRSFTELASANEMTTSVSGTSDARADGGPCTPDAAQSSA